MSERRTGAVGRTGRLSSRLWARAHGYVGAKFTEQTCSVLAEEDSYVGPWLCLFPPQSCPNFIQLFSTFLRRILRRVFLKEDAAMWRKNPT